MANYRIPPQGENATYQEWMEYAKWVEACVAPLRVNLKKTASQGGDIKIEQKRLKEFCNRSNTLLCIYRKYKKAEQANELISDLLLIAENATKWNNYFSLQLLTIENLSSGKNIAKYDSDIKERLRDAIEISIEKQSKRSEWDFWLHIGGLVVLRRLAESDQERLLIDRRIMQAKIQGAETCFLENPNTAEGWLREAAQIADSRLHNKKLTGELLERSKQASAYARDGHRLPPNAQEITDDLTSIISRGLMDRHGERFLPELQELIEYHTSPTEGHQGLWQIRILPKVALQFLRNCIEKQSLLQKHGQNFIDVNNARGLISRLIQDQRLLIDFQEVGARKEKFGNRGLLAWLESRRIDSLGNIRGIEDEQLPYMEQNTREIAEAVGKIFVSWQNSTLITQASINEYLRNAISNYDWRLVNRGIERHFDGDYYSSVHILTPQLEALVTHQVSSVTPTTKFDRKVANQERLAKVYLSDFLNPSPSNSEVANFMGKGLFWLALVFLVESRGSFNIRNKVAHGIIRPLECNSTTSATLIFLVLHTASLTTD